MSDIKSIINVTATQGLTSGSFTHTKAINNTPDVCIIRSINYAGPINELGGMYLIRSSITGDFIGSFSITPIATVATSVNSNPQTTIMMSNKTAFDQIEFSIWVINSGSNVLSQYTGLTGDLAIHMDFVQYKKV